MGQIINLTMQQTVLPAFAVTDQNNNPVPVGGYTVTGTVSDPTVLAFDTNPTTIVPLKAGTATVTWTITGKGNYSGTLSLGPDTVNVSSIPLQAATVTYTVQG